MDLYRYGGNCKDIQFGYSLCDIDANRLDLAFVDWYALDKLTDLITGGISSVQDLFAAEMALRAIIFHDRIHEIRPSLKIQIINSGASRFVYNDHPSVNQRETLSKVLKLSDHSVRLLGVDQLFKFADDVDVHEYLEEREKWRQQNLLKEQELDKLLGKPLSRIDVKTAPLELAAPNKDAFFTDVFLASDRRLKRFLSPLSASGYAVYLGNPAINQKYDQLRNYNAEEFFGVLDDGWKNYHRKLRRRLQIPVPLFLSIILSRTSDRDSIPDEISYLKQEFSEARTQLWNLFDEADFRVYDTTVAVRILSDIEREAAAVIPKALKAGEFWFPVRFDWLGRVAEFGATGTISNPVDFIRDALPGKCIRVDAANIVKKCLQGIELRGLLDNILTDEELKQIGNSGGQFT